MGVHVLRVDFIFVTGEASNHGQAVTTVPHWSGFTPG